MRGRHVIAHRGASAEAPEHTAAALRAAARSGAGMVEVDVQLTRDARLVVFHDARLERTTDGAGRLSATAFRRLRRLDAGTWFHPRFARQRVLLLTEAVRLVPRRMRVILELKRTPRRAALMRRMVRWLARRPDRHRLVCSSNDAWMLGRLKASRVARALIARRLADRSLRQAIHLGCEAWLPRHTLVTRGRIRRAHTAGLAVYAWTVNTMVRVRQLQRLGVDGIFTDDPARLVRAR